MNQTVTLVLLLSGTSTMPAERRALGAYQAREKVTLVSPGGAPAPPVPLGRTAAYSAEVALHVEAELDEAQTLATSLDEERALALLASVEKELLAHPELPQAAWLMAERHQLAAAIRRKQPGGAEEAAALAASAEALEGPRAGAFGDSDAESAQERREPSPRALLAARDLDPADTLVLDGRAASREGSVLPGRHHARVVRGTSIVWAGWLDVPGGTRIERVLGVPPRVACSEEDLAEVTIGSGSPGVPRGVRCERWIGVRRGKAGLEVARCERERCEAYAPLPPERAEKAAASLPPWLAATLVGAAAVGAGTILVLTGSFDRDKPPTTTTWVYQGPK